MTPGESELSVIQRQTRVLSDTYAALPTSGLRAGDLAYATDRETLYRWTGAAWSSITIYANSGAYGDIPPAANLPDGSLYYTTDTAILYQVQSSAWVAIVSETGWKVIGTAAPSAAATIDVTFTAYDLIKVLFRLVHSADSLLHLRLNDIAAGQYGRRYVDHAAWAVTGGADTSLQLLDALASKPTFGELFIDGRHADGVKGIFLAGAPVTFDDFQMLNGSLTGNSADLTKVTLYPSAGTITGAIEVHGKNF